MSPPFSIDGIEVELHVSLGTTMSRAGSTGKSLLSEADAAMYRAKELGRGRAMAFDDSLHTRTEATLEGERALRAGIGRRELVAHFQPIVDLGSGAVRGVEALARWHTGDGHVVLPIDFIPLAEASGMIVDLGGIILTHAVTEVAAWNAEHPRDTPLWVSVNLSAVQLADRRLTKQVAAVLRESGLPPSLLHLEITETFVMQDIRQSVAILGELKESGVKLSIDDFGTGYSSLAYLQQLPVDTLKIDRAFVSQLGITGTNASIVKAIVGLAEALDMSCVAEGVETDAQRADLVDLGCELGQGYLWSKPMGALEARTWTGSRRSGPRI